MAIPDPMAVIMTPTIIGSMRNPDSVTPAPVDICRNVGRNASAENMPMPSTRPISVAMVKVRFLNRCSGSSGSSARFSTRTNATTDTTTAATRPSNHGSDQS